MNVESLYVNISSWSALLPAPNWSRCAQPPPLRHRGRAPPPVLAVEQLGRANPGPLCRQQLLRQRRVDEAEAAPGVHQPQQPHEPVSGRLAPELGQEGLVFPLEPAEVPRLTYQ